MSVELRVQSSRWQWRWHSESGSCTLSVECIHVNKRRRYFCVSHLRLTNSSLAMARSVLNTVTCTLQICQIDHEIRKLRRIPAHGLAWSTFTDCGVGRGAISAGSGVNCKWRMNAIASASGDERIADAKKVIDEVLLSNGSDSAGQLAEVSWALYAGVETKKLLADAVTELSGCRGQDYGGFLRSVEAHGVWEVFYAPHIFTLSSMLVSKIRPLQYVLTESGFESNARYFSPLFGEGWLSASGDYVVRDEKTVDIVFDSFWSDSGRDNLQPDPKNEGAIQRVIVNILGKAAFIKPLSVYPVHYVDADVVVFEFTILRTLIAARKMRTS